MSLFLQFAVRGDTSTPAVAHDGNVGAQQRSPRPGLRVCASVFVLFEIPSVFLFVFCLFLVCFQGDG